MGDKGMTSLVGGTRVPKDSLRLDAYGTVDELNSIIGIIRAFVADYRSGLGSDFTCYCELLRRIQNELFDAGSELATPAGVDYPGMHRMGKAEVEQLELEIDEMNEDLQPLDSFTLPGGGKLNGFLHLARTVCRRAERICWSTHRSEPLSEGLLIYLNRLSDHLFVQSRWISQRLREAEFLWDRGRRGADSPPDKKLSNL
jgi:cob(I)alamin adenosyltransferase